MIDFRESVLCCNTHNTLRAILPSLTLVSHKKLTDPQYNCVLRNAHSVKFVAFSSVFRRLNIFSVLTELFEIQRYFVFFDKAVLVV